MARVWSSRLMPLSLSGVSPTQWTRTVSIDSDRPQQTVYSRTIGLSVWRLRQRGVRWMAVRWDRWVMRGGCGGCPLSRPLRGLSPDLSHAGLQEVTDQRTQIGRWPHSGGCLSRGYSDGPYSDSPTVQLSPTGDDTTATGRLWYDHCRDTRREPTPVEPGRRAAHVCPCLAGTRWLLRGA